MDAKRRSSRRDFLKGRSAGDSLADVIDSALAGPEATGTAPAAPLAEPAPANYLVRVARRAMACQFEIYLNAGQHERAMDASLEALDLIEATEDQLSVFRDHSELSRLNRSAADEAVAVEQGLFDLLKRTKDLHGRTGGALDITAEPLTKVWGFKKRAGAVPDAELIAGALARVGSQYVELDSAKSTVRFLREGVEINLGAIGKGYAVDRAAELLDSREVGDFMLHGGQSSVLARGARGGMAGGGWVVGLPHPHRPHTSLGEIVLRDRALATSGSSMQFFMYQGRRLGHILDCRTGWPIEGVLSATALAPTAEMADALSTAFYVLGPEGAQRFCEENDGVASILVTAGRRRSAVEIHTAGALDDAWHAFDGDG